MGRALKRAGVLAAAAALVVGTAGAAVAEGTAARGAAGVDPAAAQAALDRMTSTGLAGVQARIVDGDEVLVLRSGVARLGGDRPVPLDGRFRVGSVTKTFTSVVLLQLVGEGKVELDAPVARYLPGLLPDGERITVRMLLQHTSGLFNYTAALPLTPEGFQEIRFRRFDPRELVRIATSRPLDFPPGTSWSYSNTNYVVAGLLIERVTGDSYERAVERRVLRPLGLRETTTPRGSGIPGPHAHGYLPVGGGHLDVTAMNPSMAWAAGGMISTTADLDKFITALLGGRLLAPAQLAEMMRTTGNTQGYGLGLARTELPCGAVTWGHDGSIPGYATVVMSTRDTGRRLEVSATTASELGGVEGLPELLAEALCP